MKSLIIALSLLLAYAPIVCAEEVSGDDFGIETGPEVLVDDMSNVGEDAARSSKDEIGEIVILEGAGNVAIAKYIPNPSSDVEENDENADENVVDEVESLPDNQEDSIQEAIPEVAPEVPVEVQTETETVVPAEDTQNNNTPDDTAEVVIIEETESANAAAQPESLAEENTPEETVTVEEVVIETKPETEISESKEDSNASQEENNEPAENAEMQAVVEGEPIASETPAVVEGEPIASETTAVVEEEAVVAEKPAVVEEEPEDDGKTKEEYDEEISYYIKNMNLSVEQLDMAKYISSDSRLKMDQLLKSIYLLRAQARELEAKSLDDFEAILTEEQKEQFHKLRATQEKSRKKFEVFDVQAMEEDNVENQPQDAAENGENKPAE